jgi:DNA adenine methylase
MKPFVKYPGNKHTIFELIAPYLLPAQRLVEPFVGAGGIWLNTDYPSYWLNDSNVYLIGLFDAVLQNEKFIEQAKVYFQSATNEAAEYYRIRSLFNQQKDSLESGPRLLYLLRHCFNGLMRFNSKGEFNVSFGDYKSPYFPEKELLFFKEKAKTANFQNSDFRSIVPYAWHGDFVCCDPPYIPISKSANFVNYGGRTFDIYDHKDLAIYMETNRNKGISGIVFNSDCALSRTIYSNASRVVEYEVQRSISCGPRRKAKEVMFLYKGEK